ncbi:MAG: glycoside hydrolase family 3 N-terminal domain-containing protein [Methyloceanibacter sp.]|uniref:glycoside hydrolase family 3 N-terminal domain-containing protein n=1 Tax=Methyloceanibacter sp. TaxID=1965321 RepID=UPI003D6C9155
MIGQMIMVGFPGADEKDAGVIAVRRQLADGVIGGVVLFPDNIGSPEQLKSLIAYLRNARSTPAPFIAVDQEGGKVQRLARRNGHRHFPSARSVGRNPAYASPEAAKRLYAELAAELAEAGFNMNLGPVVDLNLNPSNPVIGARDRSFGADPNIVTALATAFIKAHRAANIVTVAKHFPGHGSSVADSHKALADISETWRAVELVPYQRLAKDGLLDAVMVGHLYHPRFSDREMLPASLSAKAMRALREKSWINFGGIVISDDMEMGAVRDDFTMDDLVTKAINAGTDLLVFSNQQSHDSELGTHVHAAIARAVCEGRVSRSRIEQAYGRIMLLKRRLQQKDLAGKW